MSCGILATIMLATPITLGGPGSGNFGHAGRPGQVGGSAPAEGGSDLAAGLRAAGLPADLPIHDIGAGAVKEALAERRWAIEAAPSRFSRDSWTLTVAPKVVEGVTTVEDRYGDRVFYDTRLASVQGGPDAPSIEVTAPGWTPDLPAQAEAGALFRGMRYEEYQAARRTGRIASKGEFNIGDEQTGLTFFSTDPEQARSYASGFAPWQHAPTFDRPAVVVRVKDPGTAKPLTGTGVGPTERGVPGGVALADVTDVYIGRPYRIKPGNVELYQTWDRQTGKPVYTEGSRLSPSVWVVWKRVAPGASGLALRHAYRLGFCLTCRALVRDCVQLAEWDESLHPRDERGRFTEAGGGTAAGTAPATESVAGELGGEASASAEQILTSVATTEYHTQTVVESVTHPMDRLMRARALVAEGAKTEAVLAALGPDASVQFERLFAVAKVANGELADTLKDLGSRLGPDVEIQQGPIKGLARAVEKAVNKDTGNAVYLRDPVRASVAVESTADLSKTIVALHRTLKAKGGAIVEADDRFSKPTVAGYRDLNLTVRLPSGLLGEVQMHLKPILAVKNGEGHRIYESFRRLAERSERTPADEAEMERLMARSRALYDAAWQRAGGT